MIYYIKNKYISLAVNSDGGSMASVRLWQGGEYWKSQDVAIFPIIGHAGEYEVDGKAYTPKSHGVARYSEFALADISVDRITLELNSNTVTKLTYPYDFDFLITYLLKKNSITVTYTVRAKNGKIQFYENTERPIVYHMNGETVELGETKRFVADKAFFKQCKTLQLGNLSGGKIYAYTTDGYKYTYKSDCPLFAFWSNEEGGDYICVEPWWGINDYDGAPKEMKDKPFINFADENGKSFSYTLTVEKVQK